MRRRIWAAGVLGLIAFAVGCSMCQNPYDYHGPVMSPGCPNYGFNAREGSILSGGPGPHGAGPYATTAAPTLAPTPPLSPAPATRSSGTSTASSTAAPRR